MLGNRPALRRIAWVGTPGVLVRLLIAEKLPLSALQELEDLGGCCLVS